MRPKIEVVGELLALLLKYMPLERKVATLRNSELSNKVNIKLKRAG